MLTLAVLLISCIRKRPPYLYMGADLVFISFVVPLAAVE